MTSQDYANRKPNAKKGKGKARGGRKKAQPTRRFPVLLTLVTIGLVAGFVYLLWSINDSAPEQSKPAETVTKPESKPAKKKDPKALPPKPKEEWTYQQELENKQVEVDIPEAKAATRPYQMQCASFRSADQADEMKAVIAFQGLEAQVRATQGKSGTWHKVVLGPYDTKRAAERDRHVLQRSGMNGCQIWFWEGD